MKSLVLLLLVMVLVACSSPLPHAAPTAVLTSTDVSIPTITSAPTHTPISTIPSTPTDTPAPTVTPIPSDTPAPTVTPIPSDTPTPIPLPSVTEGRFMFMTLSGVGLGVSVMDADGSDFTDLDLEGDIKPPSWSPDGTLITFEYCDFGCDSTYQYCDYWCDIYVVKPDGSDLTNLTNHSGSNQSGKSPVWSPDGTQIAFVSDRDGIQGIYLINTDNYAITRLSGSQEPEELSWPEVTWSPDSNRIAFECGKDICVIEVDSLKITNLTDSGPSLGSYHSPSWSPVDTQILFSCTDWDTFRKICVVNADRPGSTTVIAEDFDYVANSSWSPDGKNILFSSSDIIYVMNADGSNPISLVPDLPLAVSYMMGSGGLTYSPDGTYIAFFAFFMGDWAIYTMKADGSELAYLKSFPNVGGLDCLSWAP